MDLRPAITLTLTLPAFANGSRIPDEYSAEGENLSPEVKWAGVPEGTRSLALVAYDPDAPLPAGFVHWVAYGIPPSSWGLAAGERAPIEGPNTAGKAGYMGPKPPVGHGTHHYFFVLFALDIELDETGLSWDDLRARITGHVLEQERYVGTFSA